MVEQKKSLEFLVTFLFSKSLCHYSRILACMRGCIFEVLCSDSVTSLLNRQYVTWAWDVTQKANASILMNWLHRLDVREAPRAIGGLIFSSKFRNVDS